MEFVELTMLLAAVLLLIFRPQQERTAWWLLIVSWFVTFLTYFGHVSHTFLGSLNL